MSKKIFIVTGEASGDHHGAELVKSLKKVVPDAKFFGVGGSLMHAAGVEIVYPIGQLSIVGISGVIMQLPKIVRLFRFLTEKLKAIKPDLVILVDYPGFNLRFAGIAWKNSFPVVYYVSPQIWAWGKWRYKAIKKYVKKIIVFFKFEEIFYKKLGINAEFVGHPSVGAVKPSKSDENLRKEFGLGNNTVIALLPGSRVSEVKRLLPLMLDSFKRIRSEKKDAIVIIAKYKGLPRELYENILKESGLDYLLIDKRPYDCVRASDLVLVASGSATLETAILKRPMIITYKFSFLTALLVFLFVRLKHAGLVNIVAGKRLVPEIFQYSATPRSLSKAALDILNSSEKLNKINEGFRELEGILGPPGASERAASSIAGFLKG